MQLLHRISQDKQDLAMVTIAINADVSLQAIGFVRRKVIVFAVGYNV